VCSIRVDLRSVRVCDQDKVTMTLTTDDGTGITLIR